MEVVEIPPVTSTLDLGKPLSFFGKQFCQSLFLVQLESIMQQ